MPDWLTYVLTGMGGGATTGIPLILWAWSRTIKIRQDERSHEAEIDLKIRRDEYELDKIRKSDAYKEILAVVEVLKTEAILRDKKIAAITDENVGCAKKSALQDAELYKQASIIQFLEARIKNLETFTLQVKSGAPQNDENVKLLLTPTETKKE